MRWDTQNKNGSQHDPEGKPFLTTCPPWRHEMQAGRPLFTTCRLREAKATASRFARPASQYYDCDCESSFFSRTRMRSQMSCRSPHVRRGRKAGPYCTYCNLRSTRACLLHVLQLELAVNVQLALYNRDAIKSSNHNHVACVKRCTILRSATVLAETLTHARLDPKWCYGSAHSHTQCTNQTQKLTPGTDGHTPPLLCLSLTPMT